MFGILLVEIQYRFRCDMAFIEPMHRNKPNITYCNTPSGGDMHMYGEILVKYLMDVQW